MLEGLSYLVRQKACQFKKLVAVIVVISRQGK